MARLDDGARTPALGSGYRSALLQKDVVVESGGGG